MSHAASVLYWCPNRALWCSGSCGVLDFRRSLPLFETVDTLVENGYRRLMIATPALALYCAGCRHGLS